jgi:hypothetical protein
MKLACISLHKPWCYFVALGWKTIETRTHQRFKSLVGQHIGIHAAAHWDKNWKSLAGAFMLPSAIEETECWERAIMPSSIICTTYVMEHRVLGGVRDSVRSMIDCTNTQRYGLDLGPPRMVPNRDCFKCKGHQGIFYREVDL